MALLFGPAEYFSLMVLGLIFAVVLAKGSILKALTMILSGLLLSMIGSDLETGAERMTLGIPELSDGIGFVVVGMGVFGFGEILRNLESDRDAATSSQAKITGLMPTLPDLKASAGAIGRGTIIGSVLGILPGGGAIIAAFAAYTFEKQMSKTPQRFGRGAIEGVAAPESANNAAAQTSFIPLLTLGIPPNPVMALMVGAMTIHGIVPGPQVMTKQPELFWGMIASMWIGNLMLVVINLPLVGVWVRLLRVPYRHLFPMIVIFCCIGVYSINNAPSDVIDDGDLRRGRLLAGEARLRAGADDARLRARPADGGKPAPRHADRARRRHGVPDAADLGRRCWRSRRSCWCSAILPMLARQARRGVHRRARRTSTKRRAPRRTYFGRLGVFVCERPSHINGTRTSWRRRTMTVFRRLAGLLGRSARPGAVPAAAQDYPTRPITLIVPFAAGGPTDVIARIVDRPHGEDARPDLRDRKRGRRRRHHRHRPAPSARATTATPSRWGIWARMPPRPRSIPICNTIRVNDFEPIGLAAGTPILILAKKDFPPKDLKEFAAYVKQNADKINFAHAGVGSVSFTTCLLLNHILGIKPTSIPYQGTGPSMNALVGGQVDYMCDQIVNAVPQIKGGTIKAYAIAHRRAQSVAAGRADHQGSRAAGVPGVGLERAVRAEGHAEGDRRQAVGRALQGARRRGHAQAAARTRQRHSGQGPPRRRAAGGAGQERDRQVGAGHQGGRRNRQLIARSRMLERPPSGGRSCFAMVTAS